MDRGNSNRVSIIQSRRRNHPREAIVVSNSARIGTRLSILHLLVWTMLVAVVMAANTLGMRLYALVYRGGVREWMPTIAAPINWLRSRFGR